MDLRVRPFREHDGESEAPLLRVAPRGKKGGERRRVDEVGVAEVEDDPASLVQLHGQLILEPRRRVGVVLAHQRDDSRWRISGS